MFVCRSTFSKKRHHSVHIVTVRTECVSVNVAIFTELLKVLTLGAFVCLYLTYLFYISTGWKFFLFTYSLCRTLQGLTQYISHSYIVKPNC